jgi:hypothetical protein
MDWLTGLLSSAVSNAAGTIESGVYANVAANIDQYRSAGPRLRALATRLIALRQTPRGRNDLDFGRAVSELDAQVSVVRQQYQDAMNKVDQLVGSADNMSLGNFASAAPQFALALSTAKSAAGSVDDVAARVAALETAAGTNAPVGSSIPWGLVIGIGVVALIVINRRK